MSTEPQRREDLTFTTDCISKAVFAFVGPPLGLMISSGEANEVVIPSIENNSANNFIFVGRPAL
jgi:hypothetical protein